MCSVMRAALIIAPLCSFVESFIKTPDAICHMPFITCWLTNLPSSHHTAGQTALTYPPCSGLLPPRPLLNTARVRFSLKAETRFDRDTSVKPDSLSLQPKTNTRARTYARTAIACWRERTKNEINSLICPCRLVRAVNVCTHYTNTSAFSSCHYWISASANSCPDHVSKAKAVSYRMRVQWKSLNNLHIHFYIVSVHIEDFELVWFHFNIYWILI